MFREMRRKEQRLEESEIIEVLNKCTTGVLGVIGDNGYPYTVPLNYVYFDNKIYFHCATKGHKLDAINDNCSKVSFTVIEKEIVVPKDFSTNYTSVIAFGNAMIVNSKNEKIYALKMLIEKYSPEFSNTGYKEIDKYNKATNVVKIDIEHFSGKKDKSQINK